jgi:hypothetical protein
MAGDRTMTVPRDTDVWSNLPIGRVTRDLRDAPHVDAGSRENPLTLAPMVHH